MIGELALVAAVVTAAQTDRYLELAQMAVEVMVAADSAGQHEFLLDVDPMDGAERGGRHGEEMRRLARSLDLGAATFRLTLGCERSEALQSCGFSGDAQVLVQFGALEVSGTQAELGLVVYQPSPRAGYYLSNLTAVFELREGEWVFERWIQGART